MTYCRVETTSKLWPHDMTRPGQSRATARPGKPLSRGAITTSFRICRDRDNKGVEREETCGGDDGCRLTIRLGVCLLLQWGPGRMDFMHIWGQKEATWNTLFSIFERWRDPQMLRGPWNPPPSRRACELLLLWGGIVISWACLLVVCFIRSFVISWVCWFVR